MSIYDPISIFLNIEPLSKKINIDQDDHEPFHMKAHVPLSSGYKGVWHTEEAKKRIGEASRNRKRNPHTDEVRKQISEKTKGKKKSSDHAANISKARKGRATPNSTKAKISESLKQKVVCPHCNKEGAKRIMSRWHFSNCKSMTS